MKSHHLLHQPAWGHKSPEPPKRREANVLAYCPSWDRTRTLLIQRKAACCLATAVRCAYGASPSLGAVNRATSPQRKRSRRPTPTIRHIIGGQRVAACHVALVGGAA